MGETTEADPFVNLPAPGLARAPALGIQQMPRAEERVAGHDLTRTGAVRNARGVSQVDRVLVREPGKERAKDGQPADPAVEDADRGAARIGRVHRLLKMRARRGCR